MIQTCKWQTKQIKRNTKTPNAAAAAALATTQKGCHVNLSCEI
jgi:hypothetical protein